MIQKKICMLGGFAVGKTSLVSRYVSSIFSDKYLTTVGVKVDKKQVAVDGRSVTLMLWDIAGQDDFQTVQASYLRGMSGYLLVVDGTRQRDARDRHGSSRRKPTERRVTCRSSCMLNKSDLRIEWEIDEPAVLQARRAGLARRPDQREDRRRRGERVRAVGAVDAADAPFMSAPA